MREVNSDTDLPPVFYCKPVNEKGGTRHASDCNHCSSFVLQLKGKQHTKDRKPGNHQDHFRCTITFGFFGKLHQYEDECHIKKAESDNLKRQEAERQRNQTPSKTPKNGDKWVHTRVQQQQRTQHTNTRATFWYYTANTCTAQNHQSKQTNQH